MKVFARHKSFLMEMLVYLLYIVTVTCLFWWLTVKHFSLAEILSLEDTVQLNLDSIASFLGIIAAALAVIISNRQESKKEQQASRDQVYQQLELESINLFRFEIDNPELALIIWDDSRPYSDLRHNDLEFFRVLQHICQILNLFEMAVRFKRDGVVHEDVFNSWETWIFDLCKSEIFLNYWYREGVRDNYIDLFRNIIDSGLRCVHGNEVVDTIMSEVKPNESADFKEFRQRLHQQFEV